MRSLLCLIVLIILPNLLEKIKITVKQPFSSLQIVFQPLLDCKIDLILMARFSNNRYLPMHALTLNCPLWCLTGWMRYWRHAQLWVIITVRMAVQARDILTCRVLFFSLNRVLGPELLLTVAQGKRRMREPQVKPHRTLKRETFERSWNGMEDLWKLQLVHYTIY